MKKVTTSLPQKAWGSTVTKYAASSVYVSPDEFSEGSVNFDTSERGIITKRLDGTNYGSVSTKILDQFEAIFVDGTHHLIVMDSGSLKYSTGDGFFTTVRTGLSPTSNMEMAMYDDRIYMCNGITALVYDRTVGYGGAFAIPITLTVVDYTGLAGDTVRVGSNVLTEGVEWTAATDNATTAESLRTAIDALSEVNATRSGAVVTVTSETPHIVLLSDVVNLTIASVSGVRIKAAGAQPPSAALVPAVGAAGNVPAGSYTYKVTFVYYDTSESNGGAASGAVNPGGPSQIDLTDIPLGGYGVTSRKIYRSDGTTGYRLVLTIDNNTATTSTDNSAVGTAFIPEDNGVVPQFRYVVNHLDRLFYTGIDGASSDVFWSEAGQPDIVLSTNFVTCDAGDPVKAIIVYQNRPTVLNRNSFGFISGNTSDSFRYDGFPGSVGCTDNRSVQIRTINGVPTLTWLSDKGVYEFNGSTMVYISDAIERSINFNIQQSDISRASSTDTDQNDFVAGTASPAIVLDDPAGSVTVSDPQEVFDTQAAWESGSTLTNVVTKALSYQTAGKIGVPLKKTYTYPTDQATATGAIIAAASSLTLPTAANHTGAGDETTYDFLVNQDNVGVGIKIIGKVFTIARAGTLNSVHVQAHSDTSRDVKLQIRNFSGTPGSVIVEGGGTTLTGTQVISHTFNQSLSAGTYFIALATQDGFNFDSTDGAYSYTPNVSNTTYSFDNNTGIWTLLSGHTLATRYTFTQTAVTSTGSYASTAYDGGFQTEAPLQTVYLDNVSASYPAGASSITFIDTSDANDFGSGVDTASVANLNGSGSVSLPRKRYWRARVQLDTTDDRTPPVYNQLSIGWGSTAIWISPTIDHTTDITALNNLIVTASIPAGSSGSAIIQKSTDDITYADSGTFALANGTQTISLATVTNPTHRYTRVKITLVGNANQPTVVAQVSSARLTWTTTSTFNSASIDTGATPAGWDIFSTSTTLNGGTVAYYMRSAATEGGLSAASYVAVTTGNFPVGVPILQWAQWRAVITATANNVPRIDSVTIAWFQGSGAAPIRVASMFFNGSYYLSAAEQGETTNNLLFVLDRQNKWHIYNGTNIATMGFFFNRPMVGLADTPVFRQWLTSNTANGDPITLDFRTKALDFGAADQIKVLRSIKVIVENTGAAWAFTYSVDGGVTFSPLRDRTGATSFTTVNDPTSAPNVQTLVPVWPNEMSGRTIMIRGVSADTNDAACYEVMIKAFIREGEPTYV